MNVLLTGSNGFVGRHLAPLIEKAGYTLYRVVRKSSGLPNEILWDLSNPPLDSLPSCNIVVHLAAYFSMDQKYDPLCYLVNTISALNLSKYCIQRNAYLILASTIGIHGSASRINADTPIHPKSDYGMSKLLAEQVVRTFLENASILRICGIYGLNGPVHLGLNGSLNRLIHNGMFPILVGAGSGLRNYICVHDVARWISQLITDRMESTSDNRSSGIATFYLAGPEVMALRQYLQTMVDIFFPGEIVSPSEGHDSPDCVVDSSPPPFRLSLFHEYLSRLKNHGHT